MVKDPSAFLILTRRQNGGKQIAVDAAQLYHAFVQLVDKIQEKRLKRICEGRPIENCMPEQVIDTTDFMVSLKARYDGGTIPLVGVPWSEALKGVSKKLVDIPPLMTVWSRGRCRCRIGLTASWP